MFTALRSSTLARQDTSSRHFACQCMRILHDVGIKDMTHCFFKLAPFVPRYLGTRRQPLRGLASRDSSCKEGAQSAQHACILHACMHCCMQKEGSEDGKHSLVSKKGAEHAGILHRAHWRVRHCCEGREFRFELLVQVDEGAFVAHLVAVVGRRKHCRPTCQRGRERMRQRERASEREREKRARQKRRGERMSKRERKRKIEERGREGGAERDYSILAVVDTCMWAYQ